jgi:hypothetical protein
MEKLFIYADIIGFVGRAKQESEMAGRPEEDIRHGYVDSVETRLNSLQKNGILSKYHLVTQDSWLLFADEFPKAFRVIGKLLETGLNFEIAIGLNLEDNFPNGLEMYTNEMMDFLKNDIIKNYKITYKSYSGNSPRDTFILVTEEIYKELNCIKICSKPYPDKDLYVIDTKRMQATISEDPSIFEEDFELSNEIINTSEVFDRVNIDAFVGREWISDEIDAFLNDNDCGYFVIEAKAGLGKTAFMAWLVNKNNYIHHFVELAPGL